MCILQAGCGGDCLCEDKRSKDIAEDSVSLYIAECSKTPLLTAREKILSGRMELLTTAEIQSSSL